MIECIFTVDYEIYGNGEGSLRDLVYEPAERLNEIFHKWSAPFVVFTEVAELQMIEATRTDPAIDLVKRQLRDFHRSGVELGLHLHPQWCNARHMAGRWVLDYSEYNLCLLPQRRIIEIVDRAIGYLRDVLAIADFTPLSFRAGNWLFQPTQAVAEVLAQRGIKIDSSVYKGGMRHQYHLDYRGALRNGYYWKFTDKVDVPVGDGVLLELPIYTQMVPFWKLLTGKRFALEQRAHSLAQPHTAKLYRGLDLLRFHHPMKLDFCRMSLDEMRSVMNALLKQDKETPDVYKPVVAIGHSKDLVDFDAIREFLKYLAENGIAIGDFRQVLKRLEHQHA